MESREMENLEAVKIAKTHLIISEDCYGPQSPHVAPDLINLANLYMSQGQYDQADLLYKRALPITEKFLGPNHPSVVASRALLTTQYFSKGQYTLAIFEQVQTSLNEKLGEEIRENINQIFETSLKELNYSRRPQGTYAKALGCSLPIGILGSLTLMILIGMRLFFNS